MTSTFSASALQQRIDDLRMSLKGLERCLGEWGVSSYVSCSLPTMSALCTALEEDKQRLSVLSAFLVRNGHDLDRACQGYFSVLPHEVLLLILGHLRPRDLLNVVLVNSFFSSICSDEFVWQAVYHKMWPISLCFISPWRPSSTDQSSSVRKATWKQAVMKRAQTERNWEDGLYTVVHKFSAAGPLSDMAMNRCGPSASKVIVGVSAYGDRARLYDLFSGEKLQEVGLDDTGPMSLAFTDCSTLITCGQRDGGLHMWDVESGTCIRSCEEADANGVVSFDEMGSGEQSHLFVSLADKKVQVYDNRSLSRVMSLRGHRQLLVCAAARLSVGGRIASGDMDGTVMYWDLRNQASLGSAAYQDMRSRVHSVGIDPLRDVVASSSGMGHLLLWDIHGHYMPPSVPAVQVGRVVDKVRSTVGSFRAFHTSMDVITALQFRGDQHFVTAEAGGRVSAWNTKMLLNGTASNRQYVCSQEAAQAWNEVKFMLCDDERVITGSTCGIVRVHWFYPQTTANTDKVDHEQP